MIPLRFGPMVRNYPLLSVIAVDLLIVPESSAPVERTFSTAGDAASGKLNSLTDKNPERYLNLSLGRTTSLNCSLPHFFYITSYDIVNIIIVFLLTKAKHASIVLLIHTRVNNSLSSRC